MQQKKVTFLQKAVHEFEHFTDDIIPFFVIALAIVLILENPLWTIVHLENYEPWPTVFDALVLFFFIVDLMFKWVKTRNVRKFFKLYWLDIIAVFPIYLGFRAYAQLAGFFRVGEQLTETGQKLAHEAVLLREAGMLQKSEELAKEARLAETLGRGERISQPLMRMLRALKGRFYTSHRAIQSIHDEHAREHKEGY